jgi:hypothetical protein
MSWLSGCWFSLFLMLPSLASAATLYEWVDAAGETRYGYRPPPGVVGQVAGQQAHKSSELKSPVDCRELQAEHLRLIDKEIARLRGITTGNGTAFEFTAEAKQRFINDLLAHRAALLTGRVPEDFAPPQNKREMGDLKAKYDKDKSQLIEDLENQARQLQQQRIELERKRLETEMLYQRYRNLHPGLPY